MTPEMRRKVADEVRQMPHIIAMSGEIMIVAHDRHGNRTFVDSWDPVESLEQKDALTRRCAELIEEHQLDAEGAEQKAKVHDQRLVFVKAIATNSIDDLEALFYELIEVRDE
jgi:hypothetical protein